MIPLVALMSAPPTQTGIGALEAQILDRHVVGIHEDDVAGRTAAERAARAGRVGDGRIDHREQAEAAQRDRLVHDDVLVVGAGPDRDRVTGRCRVDR